MTKTWFDGWDVLYAEQGFRAKYPDEQLIRFIAGNFFKLSRQERAGVRILDLGCGPGRHVLTLAQEGFNVYGIDGSEEAIRLCREKAEQAGLSVNVSAGDFVTLDFADGYFDAVIDCVSIQHNYFDQIRKIILETQRVLKPGAKFFSMMRTDKDYAFNRARKLEEGTYCDYGKECYDLHGVGHIHFTSEKELAELFSLFKEYSYEYTVRTFNARRNSVVHWVISATK